MRSASTADRGGRERITLASASVRRVAVSVGLLFAPACGGGGPTEPAGPPTQLEEGDGNGQDWYFSNALPVAYSVVARDANGRGVPGVSVTWAVTSGGGSIAPLVIVTDGDGIASATHTLGPSAASQSVTASASGLPDVVFSVSATTPPTSAAVTVRDDTFGPTNVAVQVNGTVTWTWAASVNNEHNVHYASGPTPRPAPSATVKSGTYNAVFTLPGLYHYFCNIHANMEGDVRVVN